MKTTTILFICLLSVAAWSATPQQWGASWNWPTNVIYVDESGKEGVKTIQKAVDLANSGDVIVLYPGKYTDRKVNIPSSKRLKIKGDGLWSRWVVSDSAFSCAADSLTLENFQLEATGSGQLFWLTPASGNRPNIWLKNMTLICSTLTFVDTVLAERGTWYALQPEGIRVSGQASLLNAQEVLFGGHDIPMNDAKYGILFENGARGFLKNCQINVATSNPTNCPAVTVRDNNTKLFLYDTRIISDKGEAVMAYDSALVYGNGGYWECTDGDHAVVTDSTYAYVQLYYLNLWATLDITYRHKSTNYATATFCSFRGALYADNNSGEFHLIGINSIYTNGASPLQDSGNKIRGKPISYFTYGNDSFSGNNASLTISDPAVRAGSVTAAWYSTEDTNILSGDAVLGIDSDDGSLTLYRAESPNTSGITIRYISTFLSNSLPAP